MDVLDLPSLLHDAQSGLAFEWFPLAGRSVMLGTVVTLVLILLGDAWVSRLAAHEALPALRAP